MFNSTYSSRRSVVPLLLNKLWS